jgi:hypothetical protein
MVEGGSMRATKAEIDAVAGNVVLVATYWMSFHRLAAATRDTGESLDLGQGAHQVLALIAPFLVGDARALVDRLGRDYL